MRKYYATINEYNQPTIIEFDAKEDKYFYTVLSKKPLLNDAHLETKFSKLYASDIFDTLDGAVEHLVTTYKHRIAVFESDIQNARTYITELRVFQCVN